MMKLFARFSLALALVLSASFASAQTFLPVPVFQGTNASGDPISNGKVCSYVAGTTTPASTYTTAALSVANANPVILNGGGFASIFLVSGQSYKFILLTPGTDTTCNTGSTIWTIDNVSAIPSSSANLDLLGTAGEAITAGQAVYLSDGSGSKAAGQWFKADNTNPYSSTAGIVGIAPNAISSATAGTIRIGGYVTGLTALAIGSTYYVSTTGSLTATPPTNNIRVVGIADTTSSIVMNADPYQPPLNLWECDGRLTLTTATPVTVSDVTAATTIYFTPYKGNRCALYDGTRWTMRTLTEVSIAVPATTAQMYDVWFYDNGGTLAIELLAWTNDTTRATALTTQDGVPAKTGALTRRYVGSFRTTSVSGQTEDSDAKRFVWNYNNRVPRRLRRQEGTASWTYTTATIRQANGAAANKVEVVVGVAEVLVQLGVLVQAANTNATSGAIGIGEDSTTAFTGNSANFGMAASSVQVSPYVSLTARPAVGYHYYSWNEYSAATGTTTWIGVSAPAAQSGLDGFIQ